MAHRKRKHEEFAIDNPRPVGALDGSQAHQHSAHAEMATTQDNLSNSKAALPERTIGNGTNPDGKWEVSLSKKARKKKRKQEQSAEEESMEPSLYFHSRVVNPLRVKDLQALVLYALSDGVAPTWVAAKNAKQIDQVAVLMVPGMDKDILSAFASSVEQGGGDGNNGIDGASSPALSISTADASEYSGTGKDQTTQVSRPTPKALPGSPLSDCIVPVKAPGDPKSGRIYSPLQAMLISPAAKDSSSKLGADHVFEPVRTPISHFVHSADELVEAQYPVHPAIFTNMNDAELESARRESAGQSSTDCWVDTDVHLSALVPVQDQLQRDDLTQGMQIYALDCEMVVTTDDIYSLARISVLDWHGKVILDKIVRPALPVKDYFTQFSGITEKILEGVTTTLEDVQRELLKLCTSSTILLGHSLESDLNALKMTHPFIVDTSMLYPHPRGLPLRSSLKFLANKYLKREIQKGGADGHDSVEDARAVLDLVRLKCEKGPKWGTLDANGESIFARLNASGRRTAIVEYGTPEKGLGRLATIHIGCQDDGEVADGLVRTMSAQDPTNQVNFVWGRLREMEKARDWNSNKDQYTAPPGPQNGYGVSATSNGFDKEEPKTSDANETSATETAGGEDNKTALEKATESTVASLLRVYDSLAPSALFIVFSGPGDMREVMRLQNMQKQYKKEFKVKKWDELSVKWTDDEVQALRKTFEQARKGWGLVCLK